jgi:hypothetical protein
VKSVFNAKFTIGTVYASTGSVVGEDVGVEEGIIDGTDVGFDVLGCPAVLTVHSRVRSLNEE